MEIEIACKCKCGHLSIKFINGAWNTMTEATFKAKVGEIPKELVPVWACDGCTNNWTIENGEFKLFKIKPSVTWHR